MTTGDTPPSEGPLIGYALRSVTERDLTARRAAQLIAVITLLITAISGVIGYLVDHKDFHSLWNSMWWAVQTVTTVGYGDVVPQNVLGRIVGAILMLNGIAFLTVITAAVTATLIEQARRRRPSPELELVARLDRIESSLERIEGRIDSG
jgi:voltage-gated potassium channel